MAYQPLQLHPIIGSISKQRIIFKVTMGDAKKRSKALKTAVGFPGVLSATLQGDDRIVVEGEGLDPLKLNKKLKKKLGSAELVSLTNGHDNSSQFRHLSDGKVIDMSASVGPYPYIPVHPQPSSYYAHSTAPPPPQHYYEPYYEYDSGPSCAVM